MYDNFSTNILTVVSDVKHDWLKLTRRKKARDTTLQDVSAKEGETKVRGTTLRDVSAKEEEVKARGTTLQDLSAKEGETKARGTTLQHVGEGRGN